MSALFLSPHNDDETLFGAYTLLREHPLVVVCLRSWRMSEPGYPGNKPVNFPVREAETAAAMEVLGCAWRQLDHLDLEPVDWNAVTGSLLHLDAELAPEVVYAPAVEFEGGNEQHDQIGVIAATVFGSRVVSYLTYRFGGRPLEMIRGTMIDPATGEAALKRRALACYESQATHPVTAHHFADLYDEYLI